jgi:N-acyl-D-aspartate/D-glutamate deacylase
MGCLVRDAIAAGALGFTTSRTRNHRASDGRFTPSLTAGEDELIGIARRMGEAGGGVFEIVSDFAGRDAEWAMFRRMVEVSGRPMSISLLQADAEPEAWRHWLRTLADANAAGLPMKAQVAARAVGVLLGLDATLHPFCSHPSWSALAALPRAERLARQRDPAQRSRMLAEEPAPALAGFAFDFERLYVLGDPPDYEPTPEQSVAAEAARRGIPAAELAYDLLLADEGRQLLYRPVMNYSHGDLEAAREMLLDPNTVPGLGDAGAHVGLICDGSFPTFLLSHWGKDRSRGEKLPVEWLVKSQTSDTASLVGLRDRGRLAPGMKADLNLIEWDALGVRRPEIAFDLPAGGRRLVQRATGYRATVASGELTFEDGESTGALPGRLVRGAQASQS